MYKISRWARQHIVATRLIIAVLHIQLVLAAMWIAGQYVDLPGPQLLAIAVAGFIMVGVTGGIKKKVHDKRSRFRLQKRRFFITGICCLLLMISFFSTTSSWKYNLYGPLNGAFHPTEKKTERPDPGNYSDQQAFYKDLKTYYSSLSKKEIRREFRYQLKDLRKSSSGGMNGLYIAGIIIAMLFALLLVASLACSISCNGNDALGTAVLVLGSVGIIVLTVFLIKRVTRKKKNSTEPVKQPEPLPSQ